MMARPHVHALTSSEEILKKSLCPLPSPWPLPIPLHVDRAGMWETKKESPSYLLSSEEHLYLAGQIIKNQNYYFCEEFTCCVFLCSFPQFHTSQ